MDGISLEVKRGEFQDDQISVYFTVRQYGSLDPGASYEDELKRLRGRCEDLLGAPLPVLSMGMSGDYEVAIEEGSTLVRIGTALFGDRPRPASG